MSRHTRERSVRSDPSLTEGQRPVQLSESRRFFTAQGNQSGVRGARALQDMLTLGTSAYTSVLERRNERGSAQALGEAAAGGERDEDITNKGYNETYDKVEAANDLALFKKELPALLEKEGWLDLNEEAAQARIDEYFAGQLKGINSESVYGKIVAAGILKQNEELLGVYRDAAAAEDQQERRIAIADATTADYEETGTLDHAELMKRLQTLVPGPGGRKTYLEVVFDLAEEMGDVSIIDSIPDFFPNGDPTGKTDPNFEHLFDDARLKAQAKFDKNKKEAEDKFKADYQTERAMEHSGLTARALAGDASVFADIVNGGEDGPNGEPRLLQRGPQKTLFDQLIKAQLSNSVSGVNGDLFGQGKAYGMDTNAYDAAAMDWARRTTELYNREHPEWNDERVQAETLKVIIERSYNMNRVPKYIADFIDATPANPERFQEAVNIKAAMDAYDPALFQGAVSDTIASTMEAYSLALRDTGNHEGAMEFISQRDTTRSKGRGNDIADLAQNGLNRMATDPWLADFPITRDDIARAEKLAKHYIDLGYEDDRILDFIETGMRARNIRIDGVLYPVDSGWRTGEVAAASFLRDSGVEFFVEDPDDMIMVKHPRKNGYVVIRDSKAMMPYSSPEIKISEIEDWYDRNQHMQLINMAAGSERGADKLLVEAEKRAYAKMFPPIEWGFEGDILARNKSTRASWKALDVDTRKRLIADEIVNAEVKQPYRQYSDDDFAASGEFIRNPLYMAGPNAINAESRPADK